MSNIESQQDISCLRTRTSKALAHTCKYDKESRFYKFAPTQMVENMESKPTNHINKTTNSSSCHIT
ncbi:MAG: hypothetical protein SPJ16_01170 [Helicobacter sp.]|uniref:hypothetical protein n=1 Tax=Helicobacter sp. TaxID=218 RepID=UPI002A908788|nr:hypothetical protein [Helicobacter sp.]MDY5949800.1 hypothetical protein [Helicobacter sp.]